MSLSGFRRRMSVTSLAGVVQQGRGSVGSGGAEVGIFFFFFFMKGNTERAQCALSRVCIP